MGRSDSRFTIDKYHINTMEITKLFRANICMPVTKLLDNLVILQNEVISDLWSVQGASQRNQWQKLWILCWERKGEKKDK